MARGPQKARSPARKPREVVPKHMLLPLSAEHVRDLSLSAHLTLTACRSGRGSRHLLGELVRITYMSYFLWEAGYGSGDYRLYCEVERVLEALSEESEREARCCQDLGALKVLERIMQIYDEQIGSVSRSKFAECKLRLDRLIRVQIPERVAVLDAAESTQATAA